MPVTCFLFIPHQHWDWPIFANQLVASKFEIVTEFRNLVESGHVHPPLII